MKKVCIALIFMLALQIFPSAAVQDGVTALFFDDFEEKNESAWENDGAEIVFIEEEETQNTAYSVGGGDYFEKDTMKNLRNYAFSFNLYMDYRDSEGNFGTTWPAIRFRVNDNSCYHIYLYNEEGKEEIGFQKIVGGAETWLATAKVALTDDNEEWVPMKLVLSGDAIEIYYADEENPVISVTDAETDAPVGGSFCFISNGASKFYIDNLTVCETYPERTKAEKIAKKTDREVYRFYDYESHNGEENILSEDGNYYLDASRNMLETGKVGDFICRLNLKRDYKPYGENLPVITFGGDYEIVFDSSLSNCGIVLKKSGEELHREQLVLADDDNVWINTGFSVVGDKIEFYYGDMEKALFSFTADEVIPEGKITILGCAIDNLYIASAYRYKPVRIVSAEIKEKEGEKSVYVRAVSNLEENINATAAIAGVSDEKLLSVSAKAVTITGNEINSENKTETEITIPLPQTTAQEYIFYLWDGMTPLSDCAVSNEEPHRIKMPPDDGAVQKIVLEAKSEEKKILISGQLTGDAEQSITLLMQKLDGQSEKLSPDCSQAVYLAQVSRPAADGKFEAVIDATSFSEGDYIIFAASDDAPLVNAVTEYLKPENLTDFMGKLNLAQGAEELRLLISDPANMRYAKYYGIDAENFIALGQETLQNGVCLRVLAEKGDGFTKETIGAVFAPHIAFALLKTAQDGAGVRKLIADNPHLYPLDAEDDALYISAAEEVQQEACGGLQLGLKQGKYDDINSVMADIEPNVILASIYLSNYKDIPELLETYKTKLGIDIAELEGLTAAQSADACQLLNETRCYTYTQFAELYVESVAKAAEPSPTPTPRPVSTGGGGGGGGTIIKAEATPAPTPTPVPSAEPTQDEEKQSQNEKISYTDISHEHWSYEAIQFLSASEPPVISGYEDGSFKPDRAVTRAEFVKLIISAFGFDTSASECSFTDILEESWHYPYIAAAEKAGIVTGTDTGTFEPLTEISRQDMTVMLYRVLEIKLISLEAVCEPEFPDRDTVSVYAEKAVNTLGAAGIINGTDGGRLNPFAPATRAQAAKMIYEILK